MLYSVRTRQRLCDEIKLRAKNGLRYLHFALNVKRDHKTITVGNGNHWTYFVCSADLDELYYGDTLGWDLPSNLASVMEIVFKTLYTAFGKSYVKPRRPTLMHDAKYHLLKKKCSEDCFRGYPLQKCGSACGLNPVFLAALAYTHQNLWTDILHYRQPSKENVSLLQPLVNLSNNSDILRCFVINWIVKSDVTLRPLIKSGSGPQQYTTMNATSSNQPFNRNNVSPTKHTSNQPFNPFSVSGPFVGPLTDLMSSTTIVHHLVIAKGYDNANNFWVKSL